MPIQAKAIHTNPIQPIQANTLQANQFNQSIEFSCS
jgi:hypothetical protein